MGFLIGLELDFPGGLPSGNVTIVDTPSKDGDVP